ncbi:MAG TPA: hypothetical protein PLP07_15900, partial [Pyrinomonadaceae bacterium]|nr:hypothetical protein [Pyrinomonadaceae bacterium]
MTLEQIDLSRDEIRLRDEVARITEHAVVAPIRDPLVTGDRTYADVSNDINLIHERKAGTGWWIAFGIAVTLLTVGVIAGYLTVTIGIGTWGLNRTVGWAFDITNFVFWIGIGHAGTFISAILYLFNQKWRTSINRSAEA